METETEGKRLHRAFVEVGARIQLSDDKDHRNLHFIVWQGVGRTFAVLILAVTLLLVELNRVSSALTCESNIVSRRTYYFHHFIYFEKSTEARVYGNVCLVLHSHPLCSCFSGADRFISKLKEWLPFLGFFTAVGCCRSCLSAAFAETQRVELVCGAPHSESPT